MHKDRQRLRNKLYQLLQMRLLDYTQPWASAGTFSEGASYFRGDRIWNLWHGD